MRTYAIIELADINKIDFTQIGETSVFTLRLSVDKTQFVIKWQDGYTPTFISDNSVVPVGTYTHTEILEIMATPAWSEPVPA
jgi:hypothetical protein|tara:strand:+ start:373 stop:618 length:246 start_codon:yes stop_codon:yes gene_type:complete